jgi:Uma2 family endonuclease
MTTFVVPTEAPTVHGPPQGQWTHADWEQLPDDGNRYEIIDGVLYMTTAPSYFHQWIIQGLQEYIGIPVRRQKLGFAVAAPIGVLMPNCQPVQPDFVVVLQSNAAIIYDRRIRGVPDVMIEVLSPSNAVYDEDIKFEAYARAGLQEYVIIDPRSRTFNHYRLNAPGLYAAPQVFGESETAYLDCLPSLPIPVAELFAGAPDTTL